MTFLNKKVYFRYLSYILVITTFLPVVANNLPPIIGSFHLYAAIWFVSIIILKTKVLRLKFVFQLLIFGLLLVFVLPGTIWGSMSEWNKNEITIEFYYLVIAITVIEYYRVQQDYLGLARVVKISLIFIGVTAVLTIFSSFINPLYARNMTGGLLSDNELNYFQKLGGGAYSYASALVGLFPMLIYYYRENNKSIFPKWIIFLFGILIYYALLRMQFFANILLSSVIIIISLLGRKRIKQSLSLISLFFLIILFIPRNVYADFLRNTSVLFNQESEVHFKMNDMSDFIIISQSSSTTTEERVSRYNELLEAFIRRPFLGDASYNSGLDIAGGGHLYWMSRLTILGIFGFGFYIWIHYKFITLNIKFFDEEYAFYFLLSVFSIIFLGFMKNLVGRDVWIMYFIILPGLYYLPFLKKN